MRETPSSDASVRVDGSLVPRASAPERIDDRTDE
jgi:hypothetical protein